MTKKPLGFLLAASITLVPGCATPGVASYAHDDPTVFEMTSEVLVPMPFDEAWDKLVKELATRFYVINNIDKESRLINLSFSSDHPEQFVTGGTTTREFERDGVVENFTYDPAASSSYKIGWTWGTFNNLPATGTLFRKTTLQGRANIYIAPEEDTTRVTVNCRYILTGNVSGIFVAEDTLGNMAQQGAIPSSSSTAAFNTNAPVRVNWGSPEKPSWLTFRSTGKFEKDILSILK